MMHRTQQILAMCSILTFVSGCSSKSQSRTEINRDVLLGYVHVDGTSVSHLTLRELGIPASSGLLYCSALTLDELDDWYSTQFRVAMREDYGEDSGQAGIYFETDEDFRDSMVFIFDTRVENGRQTLKEWLNEKRYGTLPNEPGTVVLAFLDDPVEAVRILREFNREPDDG